MSAPIIHNTRPDVTLPPRADVPRFVRIALFFSIAFAITAIFMPTKVQDGNMLAFYTLMVMNDATGEALMLLALLVAAIAFASLHAWRRPFPLPGAIALAIFCVLTGIFTAMDGFGNIEVFGSGLGLIATGLSGIIMVLCGLIAAIPPAVLSRIAS